MAVSLPSPPGPRTIPRTGDDTPAGSVWGYVRRMTAWHQAMLSLLAVAVAALGFAPVELQRRIIDQAIASGDRELLIWYGALYAGVLAAGQGLKLLLLVYQGWLSESAARYTRQHLVRLHCGGRRGKRHAEGGEAVSIIGPEVDKLAGFAGEGPSTAVQHGALLLVGIGYMLYVDALVAIVGLVLLGPQVVWAPLMQRRMNRLMRLRVRLMRTLGNRIAGASLCEAGSGGSILGRIYDNRMRIHAWKALTKAGLNFVNGLAPLSVLFVGGWLAIQGETTVGVIVAFVSGFQRLADPLRALIQFYRRCAQAQVQHDMIARWM